MRFARHKRSPPASIVIQSCKGHDSIGRAAQRVTQVFCLPVTTDQPQPTSYYYHQ
ncbi:hypothetical protein OK016_27315 [Vibrio chagasii]|nr:hypothetical protein [Vibrio chagasii]